MKQSMTLLLLLTGAQAWAMEPPEMEWSMQFYPSLASVFRSALLPPDGSYLLAGRIWNGLDAFLVCMDAEGDTLWTTGDDWDSQNAYCAQICDGGDYIITGASLNPSSSSGELFVAKTDSFGEMLWDVTYDVPGSNELGYAIVSLPDGGCAVSGRVNSTGSQNGQAWILRLDSEGDTLWTETWGTHTINFAKGILFRNDTLVVLAQGSGPGLSFGAHLLFYDLDGNYLHGTSYPGVVGYAADICHAPDGGFTFISTGGALVHTDGEGTLLWSNLDRPAPLAQEIRWASLSPCMDDGYIIAGSWWSMWQPNDLEETWGLLSRVDSLGNELWFVFVGPPGDDEVEFFSARQLSEGGYIVSGYYNDVEGGTGINGYIVRYAPETSIGEWESPSGEAASLSAWPNPSGGPVQISLDGPEGLYGLAIYDLQGHLVRDYPEVPLGGGAVLLWNACSDSGESLPAGVYVARLQGTDGVLSTRLMRL